MKFVPLTEFRKDFQVALGEVVIAMGHVENQINFLLVQMLGFNNRLAANLTFGYHLDDVIKIIKAVFYSMDREASETMIFEYLISELSRLQGERNKNIHCSWQIHDEKKQAIRFKLGKHKQGKLPVQDWKEVTIPELKSINEQLYVLLDDILAFSGEFFPPPGVSLDPETKQLLQERIPRLLEKTNKSKASK
jgi:hypothetical protein